MPTARVSPAPTSTSSQAAYGEPRRAPDQHSGSGGSSHHGDPRSRVSSGYEGAPRGAFSPPESCGTFAERNVRGPHTGKKSCFNFGQRYYNYGFQYPAHNGHVQTSGGNSRSHPKNKNPFSKTIKSQSGNDCNNSNCSSGSSNHISLGNASSDNDSGSSGSLRVAWSNCAADETNRFPASLSGGVGSLFGFGASQPGLSPYQKVLKSLAEDERWQREITLGRRIGFYRFRGEIGNGNFSQVKVALHTLTKEKVAVKILDKSKLDAKTQRMLSREITSMEKLHHPNLVRLFEVVETFSKIYLVIEFASGGELFQKISGEGKFEESVAKPLFAQIVSAIDHMHQHHIVHRDIKAENVFFADAKTVKVGDFGFSTEIRNRQELLNTFCGSPPYAAPELFSDESYVGPCVDLWALGVLLYFMTTGVMPFKAQTVTALKKIILDGEYTVPDYLSCECVQLVRGLLQQRPSSRTSIKSLRESEWLRGSSFPISLPKYKLSQGIKEAARDMSCEAAVAAKTRADEKARKKELVSNADGDEPGREDKKVEGEDDAGSGDANVDGEVEDETSITKCVERATKRSPAVHLSTDEKEAYRQLRELGISGEMIDESREKGVRCNIIGTYRMVLHRVVARRYYETTQGGSASSGKKRTSFAAGTGTGSQSESRPGTARCGGVEAGAVSTAAQSSKSDKESLRRWHRKSKEGDVRQKEEAQTGSGSGVGAGSAAATTLAKTEKEDEANEEADKLMKSLKKSNKSIKSIKALGLGVSNNNTVMLGAGGQYAGKPCTFDPRPLLRDHASGDRRVDSEGYLCPSRPITNNFMDNCYEKKSGKKRWKNRKLSKACSIL